MTGMNISAPVELTEAELDAVAGGAGGDHNNQSGSLVAVNVQDVNVIANVAAQALTANSSQTFTPINTP